MDWSGFSLRDWQTVGTERPTENAKLFVADACTRIQGEPHCFWTGREARKRAYEQDGYRCDNKVTYVSVLFEKGKEIQDSHVKKEFFFAVSRIFASHSTSALICVSSDKKTEPAGFTVGTNFWEAELPVLWKLKDGIAITLLLIEHHEEVKLNLSQNELMKVRIYRRYAHSLDCDKKSFVEDHYQQEDYDQWRKEKPRRGILFQDLLKWFRRWRSVVRCESERRGGQSSSW
jgi:hypothetical protein